MAQPTWLESGFKLTKEESDDEEQSDFEEEPGIDREEFVRDRMNESPRRPEHEALLAEIDASMKAAALAYDRAAREAAEAAMQRRAKELRQEPLARRARWRDEAPEGSLSGLSDSEGSVAEVYDVERPLRDMLRFDQNWQRDEPGFIGRQARELQDAVVQRQITCPDFAYQFQMKLDLARTKFQRMVFFYILHEMCANMAQRCKEQEHLDALFEQNVNLLSSFLTCILAILDSFEQVTLERQERDFFATYIFWPKRNCSRASFFAELSDDKAYQQGLATWIEKMRRSPSLAQDESPEAAHGLARAVESPAPALIEETVAKAKSVKIKPTQAPGVAPRPSKKRLIKEEPPEAPKRRLVKEEAEAEEQTLLRVKVEKF